jgi:hypothetical protein
LTYITLPKILSECYAESGVEPREPLSLLFEELVDLDDFELVDAGLFKGLFLVGLVGVRKVR